MKKLFTLAFLGAAISASAQHAETRDISQPLGIAVSTGIHAKLVNSDKNQVVLETDKQDDLQKLEAVVVKGTLFIRVKRGSKIKNAKHLSATIYINPNVNSVSLASSSSLEINDKIQVKKFEADLSSSASFIANSIEAEKIEFDLSSSAVATAHVLAKGGSVGASSSSTLNLTGESKNLEIDASSSASILLPRLEVKNANIDASSSSKIELKAPKELIANVSSSGKVIYIGKPDKFQFNKKSGGTITEK